MYDIPSSPVALERRDLVTMNPIPNRMPLYYTALNKW
jgi:hypothetical protein